MTQSDPNRLYVDADNNIKPVGERPKPKNNSAFLQLPAALEKEVNAYVNKLAKERNIEWENEENGDKSIFRSQGCFWLFPLKRLKL